MNNKNYYLIQHIPGSLTDSVCFHFLYLHSNSTREILLPPFANEKTEAHICYWVDVSHSYSISKMKSRNFLSGRRGTNNLLSSQCVHPLEELLLYFRVTHC